MEKQRKIAQKLNTIKHEIALLQQLDEKYQMQKRGLMQKLLTGEWPITNLPHSCESRNPENHNA